MAYLIKACTVFMKNGETNQFQHRESTFNFNPTEAVRVAASPRIGVGPGFDSQGSVTFFHKYCFPNLH